MLEIEYGIAVTTADFQGVEELVKTVFEDEVGLIINDLYHHSPRRKENVYLYARDRENGRVVGTLNLLSVPFRYESRFLKAAECGVAATAPDYRGLGINSRLTEIFFQECRESEINLVVLEGIPCYYRRFGFNYAVPMGGYRLSPSGIDCEKDRAAGSKQDRSGGDFLKIRAAGPGDLNYLYSEHEKAADGVGCCKVKDRKIIAAQLLEYNSATLKKEYFIVSSGGRPAGFFTLDADPLKLTVSDISDGLPFRIYQGILSYLKEEVLPEKRVRDHLYVEVPPHSSFISYLLTLGAVEKRDYSWQVRILDQFRFLKGIEPVLEERLRNSPFGSEELSFTYNNYRELVEFNYIGERLSIKKRAWAPGGRELNLTPQGAVKLFTGDKTLKEIAAFLPDCSFAENLQQVFRILFPAVSTHFYCNY